MALSGMILILTVVGLDSHDILERGILVPVNIVVYACDISAPGPACHWL